MPWTQKAKNEYMRRWKKEHKEYVNTLNREYKEDNPEKWLLWHNISWARLKAKAIVKLEGKCRMCGESNPLLLTLNHINGDGFKDKHLSTDAMYRQVLSGKRDDLELLCANCQKLFEYESGRISLVRADIFLYELKELGWSW